MKSKKQWTILIVLAMLVFSVVLVACGDTTSLPASTTTVAAATSTANLTTASTTDSSSTSAATSGTTTAADSSSTTTSAATTPSTPVPAMTPGITVGAAKNKKGTGAAMVETPDSIVKTLLNAVKSNDSKKEAAVTRLLSSSLQTTLKGSKGVAGLDKLIGISDGTNIDIITVASPNIVGDNAMVTATLKLKDGLTITDNMTLVKNTVTTKKGQANTVWQVDAIAQAK